MRSLGKNKRGQVLNAVSGTVIGIMVLIFTIFAVLYGIAVLNPKSFFASGSAESSAMGNMTANLTDGVSKFGAYIPTILIILGVVLAIAGIVVLIAYVKRMGQGGTGGL